MRTNHDVSVSRKGTTTTYRMDIFEYSRRGTKSPTMEVYVDVATGKRYTPYAFRHYGFYFTLNQMFKKVYAKTMRDLIPDGITLLRAIEEDGAFTKGGVYQVPVILGEEHGVIVKEKK